MSPLRVLVVEDDAEIRDVLVQVFEEENCTVAAARDGEEGLRLARIQHPDAITLDLMMPVMDGWSFRRQQREDPAISDIPIIVVSAVSARSEPDIDIDAAAYIPKPCDLNALVTTVAQHASRHRHHHSPEP